MAKRLTAESKAYIYSALARYVPMPDICNEVSKIEGREVSEQTIYSYKYRPQHSGEVDRLRELYRQDIIRQYPIADILYRLQVRQKLVDDLFGGDGKKLWSKSPQGADRSNHLAVNTVLNSAAEEVGNMLGGENSDSRRVLSMLFRLRHTDITALIQTGPDTAAPPIDDDEAPDD